MLWDGMQKYEMGIQLTMAKQWEQQLQGPSTDELYKQTRSTIQPSEGMKHEVNEVQHGGTLKALFEMKEAGHKSGMYAQFHLCDLS